MTSELFQLYDGTLVAAGCTKLLWHRRPIGHEALQVLWGPRMMASGMTLRPSHPVLAPHERRFASAPPAEAAARSPRGAPRGRRG